MFRPWLRKSKSDGKSSQLVIDRDSKGFFRHLERDPEISYDCGMEGLVGMIGRQMKLVPNLVCP